MIITEHDYFYDPFTERKALIIHGVAKIKWFQSVTMLNCSLKNGRAYYEPLKWKVQHHSPSLLYFAISEHPIFSSKVQHQTDQHLHFMKKSKWNRLIDSFKRRTVFRHRIYTLPKISNIVIATMNINLEIRCISIVPTLKPQLLEALQEEGFARSILISAEYLTVQASANGFIAVLHGEQG